MAGKPWTSQDERKLLRHLAVYPNATYEHRCKFFPGRTADAIRLKASDLRDKGVRFLDESPYPIYDKPLTFEGDALVLPDVEFPFHHAEHVNRCLAVAEAWGISNLLLAGDAVHLNSLSKYEPHWIADQVKSGLSDDHEREILDIAAGLPEDKREALLDVIESIGRPVEQTGANLGAELRHALPLLKRFESLFDDIYFVLGNHEGRLLRAMDAAMFTGELMRLLGLSEKFHSAPYYHGIVVSDGVEYRVSHPKSAANTVAVRIADKYQCNVLVGHSHKVLFNRSASGKYLAWHIGCCADERRLPYAAQRDNNQPAHGLGAAIIKRGYAWFLGEHNTDWDALLSIRW